MTELTREIIHIGLGKFFPHREWMLAIPIRVNKIIVETTSLVMIIIYFAFCTDSINADLNFSPAASFPSGKNIEPNSLASVNCPFKFIPVSGIIL